MNSVKFNKLLQKYQTGLGVESERSRVDAWFKNLQSPKDIANTEEAKNSVIKAPGPAFTANVPAAESDPTGVKTGRVAVFLKARSNKGIVRWPLGIKDVNNITKINHLNINFYDLKNMYS